MRSGIWTYRYLSEKWSDKFAKKLWRLGLFKTYGVKPMFDYVTGKEIGKFIRIHGNWLAVLLVDKLTEPKVTARDRKIVRDIVK
jgi:hypothetical protein